MITAWRIITKRQYPGQQYLLYIIPSPCQMLIANIAKGGCIMTDTCNTVWKLRRLLIEAINEISKKEGMTSNQINISKAGKLYNILLHDLQMKKLMKD